MLDIKLTNDTGVFDVTFENGDFTIDRGLETALVVSILSDRRASSSQVPQPELRRGWIGDLVTSLPGYKIGSHIWLFEQSRTTQETLSGIEDSAKKALDWMLSSGLIVNVDANATYNVSDSSVLLRITVTSPDGSVSMKAFNLWKETVINAKPSGTIGSISSGYGGSGYGDGGYGE